MTTIDDPTLRPIDFAARLVHVCADLPKQPAASRICDQLVRCGTTLAPKCAEACRAKSQRDFVGKWKVVLDELNETRLWLRTIVRDKLLSPEQAEPLLDECDQLCLAIRKSIAAAQRQDEP